MSVRVAVVLVKEGRVLLARHEKGGESYWVLPGGAVEPGETLAEALRRELREEAALAVEPGDILFVNDGYRPEAETVAVYFSATLTGNMALRHSSGPPSAAQGRPEGTRRAGSGSRAEEVGGPTLGNYSDGPEGPSLPAGARQPDAGGEGSPGLRSRSGCFGGVGSDPSAVLREVRWVPIAELGCLDLRPNIRSELLEYLRTGRVRCRYLGRR